MDNPKLNLTTKVFGVFLCLYIFLVGISTLSKSISGLTEPENLVAEKYMMDNLDSDDKNWLFGYLDTDESDNLDVNNWYI